MGNRQVSRSPSLSNRSAFSSSSGNMNRSSASASQQAAVPAVWAVAVAVAVAAEVVEVKPMKSKSTIVISMKLSVLAGAVLGFRSLAPALQAAPEGEQKGFETAKEAADALVQAAEPFDVPALEAILGPGSADLVATEDTVQDKNRATKFAEMAHEKSAIEVDPKNSKRATLSVGNDDWPLPIPIVKRSGKWYFDAKAGREEILLRRIGANELDVLNICRGYVEAQDEYASEKHDGSTVNQYAQRI